MKFKVENLSWIPFACVLFKNVRSHDCRNIIILYQGFPNCGVPLVICKPLKCGTRAALCQEHGGGRSWFSADLEKTGNGYLGSEHHFQCQALPHWLLLALHKDRSCSCLLQRGEGSRQREWEGRGAELQQHTHRGREVSSRSVWCLGGCTHTREPLGHHLPQPRLPSAPGELTSLDTWASRPSCTQREPAGTDTFPSFAL